MKHTRGNSSPSPHGYLFLEMPFLSASRGESAPDLGRHDIPTLLRLFEFLREEGMFDCQHAAIRPSPRRLVVAALQEDAFRGPPTCCRTPGRLVPEPVKRMVRRIRALRVHATSAVHGRYLCDSDVLREHPVSQAAALPPPRALALPSGPGGFRPVPRGAAGLPFGISPEALSFPGADGDNCANFQTLWQWTR